MSFLTRFIKKPKTGFLRKNQVIYFRQKNRFKPVPYPNSDNNRIVGGKNAPSPIPWQVSIGNADSGHWCGGTILDEETILSAAHCFTVSQTDWKGWYVMAGDTNKNGVKGQVIRIFKKKPLCRIPNL